MPIDDGMKERLIGVLQGAKEEVPDFGLFTGEEVITPEDMVQHVQEETEIGLRLLALFEEDEKESSR